MRWDNWDIVEELILCIPQLEYRHLFKENRSNVWRSILVGTCFNSFVDYYTVCPFCIWNFRLLLISAALKFATTNHEVGTNNQLCCFDTISRTFFLFFGYYAMLLAFSMSMTQCILNGLTRHFVSPLCLTSFRSSDRPITRRNETRCFFFAGKTYGGFQLVMGGSPSSLDGFC